MFIEVLVATTCIVGKAGCGAVTSAYYQSNLELQQTVKNVEKIGQNIVKGNEYIVYVLTPIYAVAIGKPATIKLNKNLNLNIDVKGSALALQWDY